MDTEHKGIDYGMGLTNIDKETGIRYGVINQNEVRWWIDSSEAHYPCDECECEQGDEDCGMSCCEPSSYFIDDGEYLAEAGQDGDIFIAKSPYYTKCQLCSPCAPGAGYIINTCEDGYKAYCFGPNWFEDDKAPYPIYRVSDDTLVEDENDTNT